MGFHLKRSWPAFVNEHLCFAKIQLEHYAEEQRHRARPAYLKAAHRASVVFLEKVWIGFLNELATRYEIKTEVASLEQLAGLVQFETAEIVRLRQVRASQSSCLSQLDTYVEQFRLAEPVRNPAHSSRNPERQSQAEVFYRAGAEDGIAKISPIELCRELEALINELRNGALEW